MKKALRESYNNYGIKVAGDRIISPIGAIMPVLKEGNGKTGKSVYTMSLLAGARVYHTAYGDIPGSCGFSCPGCYAMRGKFNCDCVVNSNAVNTILAREHLEFLEKAIRAQLDTMPGIDIRIHAAGDFVSVEYAEMWRRIVADYPVNNFWTYTKTEYETTLDGLKNGNIVKSMLPGGGFNFGHIDYILNKYAELVALGKTPYICRCTFDKNQHCENCRGCIENEFVLFVEHSTAYKAEKDPLFPAACAIVDGQKTTSAFNTACKIVAFLNGGAENE